MIKNHGKVQQRLPISGSLFQLTCHMITDNEDSSYDTSNDLSYDKKVTPSLLPWS